MGCFWSVVLTRSCSSKMYWVPDRAKRNAKALTNQMGALRKQTSVRSGWHNPLPLQPYRFAPKPFEGSRSSGGYLHANRLDLEAVGLVTEYETPLVSCCCYINQCMEYVRGFGGRAGAARGYATPRLFQEPPAPNATVRLAVLAIFAQLANWPPMGKSVAKM